MNTILKNTTRGAEKEGSTGALARGLAIVDTILNASQPLTLSEIAAQTHLDQSTTMRLLRTLEDNGQILRTQDGKRYTGSPKALMPMPLMHPLNQLRREASSLLLELSEKIRETVVLALFINHERIAIDIAQFPGSLAPYYSSWLKSDLHASGSGKALLLSLEESHWKALLGPGPYRAITPNTITSQERL
ncbi:MAG: IclR family transcriptional regulator, partial [Noviherbaspirillum sp.]